MDRVLACFATTAEDVAAMVCGSFSSMVPQASERWRRPAVKALVRPIHQELCDPELLGRLAPVCKELGTACVDEATRMLAGIDLPVDEVMPENASSRTGATGRNRHRNGRRASSAGSLPARLRGPSDQM